MINFQDRVPYNGNYRPITLDEFEELSKNRHQYNLKVLRGKVSYVTCYNYGSGPSGNKDISDLRIWPLNIEGENTSYTPSLFAKLEWSRSENGIKEIQIIKGDLVFILSPNLEDKSIVVGAIHNFTTERAFVSNSLAEKIKDSFEFS